MQTMPHLATARVARIRIEFQSKSCPCAAVTVSKDGKGLASAPTITRTNGYSFVATNAAQRLGLSSVPTSQHQNATTKQRTDCRMGERTIQQKSKQSTNRAIEQSSKRAGERLPNAPSGSPNEANMSEHARQTRTRACTHAHIHAGHPQKLFCFLSVD